MSEGSSDFLNIRQLLRSDDLSFVKQGLFLWEQFIDPSSFQEFLDQMKLLTPNAQESFANKYWNDLNTFRYIWFDEGYDMIHYEYIAAWSFGISALFPKTKTAEETEFDAVSCSITELPETITNLKKLQILRISSCGLTEIPSFIDAFQELEELDASSEDPFKYPENRIPTLPESIGNLKKLTHLLLQRVHITALPKSIGNLENVEVLHLPFNSLSSLPRSLENLKKLRHLDLQGNPLPKQEIEWIRKTLPKCRILFS